MSQNPVSPETPEVREPALPRFSVSIQRVKLDNMGIGSVSIVDRDPMMELAEGALDRFGDLLQRGEYIVPLDSPDIGQCGDGRPGEFIAAKMFGGTPALARDDAVSGNNLFYEEGESVTVAQKKMYAWRREKGLRSFAHTDDHAECGCGECAKAADAAQYLLDHYDEIKSLTASYFEATGLGPLDEDIFKSIAIRTGLLLDQGFYDSGKKQLEVFRASQHVNPNNFETVHGPHKEADWVILKNDTGVPLSLDRNAIARSFDAENLQAFVENHSEIMAELRRIAVDEASLKALQVANVARRIATAAVLTDLSQEVIFMRVAAA